MLRALIFGAGGQDGYYLAQECEERRIQPIAVSHSGADICADVASFEQVAELIREHRPAYVFHLAAASTTKHEALFANHAAIATGTLNILEACGLHCPAARIFIPGSGTQFKNMGTPITEHDPFEASSPYAVARIHATYAARYYRARGLHVCVGYLFHHESPRRQMSHVSQLIAHAARRARAGESVTLELGDPAVRKEWTFAGDVARAMFTLLDQDAPSEAVIGSGEAHSIEEWLDACFGLVGKDWRDIVSLRANFRPEYATLVSDPRTIRSLGWEPRVSFLELAAMMVRADD